MTVSIRKIQNQQSSFDRVDDWLRRDRFVVTNKHQFYRLTGVCLSLSDPSDKLLTEDEAKTALKRRRKSEPDLNRVGGRRAEDLFENNPAVSEEAKDKYTKLCLRDIEDERVEDDRDDLRRTEAVDARDWRPSDFLGSERRRRSFPKTEGDIKDYDLRTTQKIDFGGYDAAPAEDYDRGRTMYDPYDRRFEEERRGFQNRNPQEEQREEEEAVSRTDSTEEATSMYSSEGRECARGVLGAVEEGRAAANPEIAARAAVTARRRRERAFASS